MSLLNKKEINLTKTNALILAAVAGFLFMVYVITIVSLLLSSGYLEKGSRYLDNAKGVSEELILERSHLYRKAIAALEKAKERNPLDARPYFNCAEALREVAEDVELNTIIEISILRQVAPKNELSFYNLAKKKYSEAILREPTSAVAHQRLGAIHEKLSDLSAAEEEFSKALLLDPQNILIHIYLSQYFLYQGKKTDFLRHLYKVVELYKKSCSGGGPLTDTARAFFKSIGSEDLIK